MIKGTKNEEAFCLFVPIASQTAEYSCAIIERVRGNAHFGFRKGDNPPFEVRVVRVTVSRHCYTSKS